MKNDDSECFSGERYKKPEYDPTLPPLAGEILGLFKPWQPRHTLRQIVRHTRANRSTIKKRISELVHAGIMRKHGKGKATWYSL